LAQQRVDWKIWKLPFAELAAVPRFQLLTRSIKAETCKRIHRPQYLPTKRKDTAEVDGIGRNGKMVPICPTYMGGEAVEAFRKAGSTWI